MKRTMNKIKKIVAMAILIVVPMVICIGTTKNASALYNETLTDKAVLQGVYNCYIGNYVNNEVTFYSGWTDNFGNSFVMGEGDIHLPMFASVGLKNHSINCRQLFSGYDGEYFFGNKDGIPKWILSIFSNNGKFIGVMEKAGYQGVTASLLTGMGFIKDETVANSVEECIYMKYDYTYYRASDKQTYSGVVTTNKICRGNDGMIYTADAPMTDNGIELPLGPGIAPPRFELYDNLVELVVGDISCCAKTDDEPTFIGYNGDWEKFKQELTAYIEQDAKKYNFLEEGYVPCTRHEFDDIDGSSMEYRNGYVINGGGDSIDGGIIYYYNDTKKAAESAISFLSNGKFKSFNDLAFTKQEQLNYYVDGLDGFFQSERSDYWNCVSKDNSNSISGIEIRLDSSLKIVRDDRVCKINDSYKASDGFVTELNTVDHFDTYASVPMSLENVIAKINALADDEELKDSVGAEAINPDESTEYTVDEQTDECFKVAESLGWIVCPLIKKMGEAASGLYAQVSQEFIVIDAGFFEGGNSPIRIAWNDIVGFANAIMVIFLLVVVFSQITGVGIDNYGIKKVLPKIIIAAILINLSFLICQLAVELSNILGDALNTMFTNWAKNIPLETVSGQKIEEGKGLFFGLLNAISGGMLGLGAAEGASIALTIASAESTGVAIAGAVMSIIIPLLCALIIVIVAVFFFFILLGVRKACVIVLVVISPLAFVCYMLPNTKALFQKWWNALKGMLMLYPICGLMIGGGYYVSKLITSTSGNYFVQFTALLLMVVPYFFIPKMLTSSLAAMGSIGAKISGFGKNFGRRMSRSTRDASGRLGGAIKGTNRFKDWQERSAEKRTAGIVDRLRNKQKNGELSKYQTRKLAKYQSAANESYAKNLSREAVANEMHQEAVKANLDEKFADDSVRSAMSLYKNGGQYDINDVKGTGDRSMNAAYAAALADYNGNKSSDNLAKIKALQNILSGTEDGRNIIQRNLSQAAMSGNADAVDTAKAAASHLLSEHGGTYKAANRSLHSMVTDMANGNVAGAASQYKDGSYDRKTIDSYEAASFAAADDAAIDKMVDEYKKILNKDNKDITAKDIEFTNKMENLVYDMTKEGSHINVKGKIRDKISIIPPIQHKQ